MVATVGRRAFSKLALGGAAAFGLPASAGLAAARPYTGPNVIIVRFGGGVRRRETIDPDHTYSPFLRHTLAKRGALFTNMEMATAEGIETGHGHGTLYILTGKYERYKDMGDMPFRERYEAGVPTLFEYFRKAYDVPVHQALIVNGEDRPDEEFFTFGSHHMFGVRYRSEVLSLYRFKTYLLRRQIARGGDDKQIEKMKKELEKLESMDPRRGTHGTRQTPEIEAFWERWRRYYGETGLVNPRGDRLLTELAIRAMRELRPKLLMVNYQDPDYVHWGNVTHYTRAISIIDRGIQQLVAAVDSDPEYRGNTVFVVVPDCGRDSNPLMQVPYQHHFGSRSAHEIWALIVGPGIDRGVVVDRTSDQISIAATVGRLMGVGTTFAEGPVLAEAFA